MNLHCIAYQNIGPFAEQTVSVNFKAGAHLIKAPIGSGKSFLFFDGPLYALYKHQSRQMLSRTAKAGWIHCIFSVDDTVWYVERAITSTKSGNDSTKSRFYSLSISPQQIDEQLRGIDSVTFEADICKEFLGTAEQIDFTNQRELESAVQDLLPPKEVVMSVYVMVQDAQHVFELAPSERVNIFKHLFGLLGIDEGKDRIHLRRREVQGMLSVLDDQASENKKVQQALGTIQQARQSIEQAGLEDNAIRKNVGALSFIHDSSLLNESLSIDGLMISEADIAVISTAQDTVQERIVTGATIAATITSFEKALLEKNTTQKTLEQDIQRYTHTIQSLQKELNTDSNKEYDEKVAEKSALQKEIESINNSWDKGLFSQFGTPVETLFEAETQINEWINQGKQLAKDSEMVGLRLKQSEQQQTEYTSRKKELEEQYASLSAQYDEQMKFHCDKIEGVCPYVEMIKGAAGRSLQQQRDLIQQQLKDLETKKPTATTEQRKKKEQFVAQKNTIGSYLQQVGRKELIEKRKKLAAVQQSLSVIEQSLKKLENEQQLLTKKREQLQEVTIKKELQEKTLHALITEITAIQSSIQDAKKEQSLGGYVSLELLQKNITVIKETYTQLHSVVEEYVAKKQQKFALQEELKKLKDLYQIFSKELLVVVLQDFLPQLEEVINAYLSQVVEYEVRFLTPTSVDDSLELDITVHDDHGERGVKSLSGGQRAILKICWILAVASLMNSQFLFLDETITSLDASAVGRVGDLIKQFVQKSNMKLYVVTHAQQIQDMDLREEIVVL